MKTIYPRFRVSEWLDTSYEAMSQPNARFVYGVQTLREKGGKWMHCANGKKPMHFATPEEACAAIAEMSKAQIPNGSLSTSH